MFAEDEATTPEPIETPPAAQPKPKKAKGKPKLDSNLTLAQLAEGYQGQMEKDGKSSGTIASYMMELKTAMNELGEDTRVADLTPKLVQGYFESKRVTKLKSGKAKSQLSIDKTRRVLRLALCWAADRKLIEKAPLPEAPAKA